jgi:hypothetical protein
VSDDRLSYRAGLRGGLVWLGVVSSAALLFLAANCGGQQDESGGFTTLTSESGNGSDGDGPDGNGSDEDDNGPPTASNNVLLGLPTAEYFTGDFGYQEVGTKSWEIAGGPPPGASLVAVSNVADMEISILDIRIRGKNSGDFVILGGPSSPRCAPLPYLLKPHDAFQCFIDFGFIPTSVGEREAELVFVTSDGEATARIRGVGVVSDGPTGSGSE